MLRSFCYFLLANLLFSACQPTPSPRQNDWQALPLRYATQFKLFQRDSLFRIETELGQYLLYPRQNAPFDCPQGLQCLAYPVKGLALGGGSLVAYLQTLEALDQVKALAGAAYVYAPEVEKALAAGQILDLGPEPQQQIEQLLSLDFEVFMALPSQAGSPLELLKKRGKNSFFMLEYLETHPLGRVEWLRVLGLLLGRDAKAQSYCQQEFEAYESIAKSIKAQAKQAPKVLTGCQYEGIWYAAGGRSFQAQLIADAGGNYLFKDNEEVGGLPLDPERVYALRDSVGIWLNVGTMASLAALAAQDERQKSLAAWQKGQVYNYDARVSKAGAYDVFESGVLQPSVLLRDLGQIFGNLPKESDTWYYYRKLD